ncbi:MAG: recombinase family protein [Gammaproteobacteria bacterium]|nr:recombinase family protein [Gammaproteobacteria bacterium]
MSKIQAEHLERQALIYVRQSTLTQVRENVGSKARQYDLVRRAHDLGWAKEQIVVVDQDQGRSGASAEGRDGFQQLVADVGMGHAGAVFSLEASRLARSCVDWYRLLEICALTQTLVVDEESIYDPSHYNDRLLLGFKGTMSEAELHWLHSRLSGGKLKKAESGQLRLDLPTGLAYDNAGKIVFDPDEAVQQALQMLFKIFETSGSARAVVRHFRDHELRFPNRELRGPHKGELSWLRLTPGRVSSVLHNPLYAGAYVYGRTELRLEPRPGKIRPVEKRVRRTNPENWDVLIRDAHPGYINWDQYLRNQQRLDDNRTDRRESRGAAREGAALLQGIIICGKCGRRMNLRYRDHTHYYRCQQAYQEYGEPLCQFIRGEEVDAEVTALLLQAMNPAQLSVSLQALEQVEAYTKQIEQHWQLRLERAEYDANLARRRYTAVDPENRLVARNLERDWNEKLADVARLERVYAAAPRPSRLVASPDERTRILSLAQDFPTIWQASTTSNAERKQLLRFLVKDVTLTRREDDIHLGVRWQTGAVSERALPRRQRIDEIWRTPSEVIERIRALAPNQTDRQIAAQLNAEGLTTGVGQEFDRVRVRRVRLKYEIPAGCPEMPNPRDNGPRGDGRYSAKAAARLLNVSIGTINQWCCTGKLASVQSVPGSPRWITLTPEIIAKLRKPVKQSYKKRSSGR